MSEDFRVPFVSNVPVEVETEMNKRISADISYTKIKENKISKTYNNKKPTRIRMVGEYLLNNFSKEVSYKEIQEKLKLASEGLARMAVADLNFWSEYPLQMIPVPKKKGFIKSCLKDPLDTQKYLKSKSRTIATMEQVYTNTDNLARVKAKPQKKAIEVKVQEKSKNEEEEQEE